MPYLLIAAATITAFCLCARWIEKQTDGLYDYYGDDYDPFERWIDDDY